MGSTIHGDNLREEER